MYALNEVKGMKLKMRKFEKISLEQFKKDIFDDIDAYN